MDTSTFLFYKILNIGKREDILSFPISHFLELATSNRKEVLRALNSLLDWYSKDIEVSTKLKEILSEVGSDTISFEDIKDFILGLNTPCTIEEIVFEPVKEEENSLYNSYYVYPLVDTNCLPTNIEETYKIVKESLVEYFRDLGILFSDEGRFVRMTFRNLETSEEAKEYTYEDLQKSENKEILDKVLEKQVDINTEDDYWYESIIEEWVNTLRKKGFEDPEINFSGFGSQGDGASFTCDYVDLNVFLDNLDSESINYFNSKDISEVKRILNNDDELVISVNRGSSRYFHERSVNIDWYLNATDDSEYDEEKIKSFANSLDDYRIVICQELYNNLREEYYYLISDQAILETIEANQYVFDEEGNIIA